MTRRPVLLAAILALCACESASDPLPDVDPLAPPPHRDADGPAIVDGGSEASPDTSPDPDGSRADRPDATGLDAAAPLKRIFLMHVQPPLQPHTAPYAVTGYYGKVAILRCQWGPCFVDVTTGQVRWDIVTNNEYPGEGRYPGPGVDRHGCCMSMSIEGGELLVMNDGTENPFPGNTLAYDLVAQPGAFLRVFDSNVAPGNMGTQTSDPNGHTWRIVPENVTFTPSFREDWVLLRDDVP